MIFLTGPHGSGKTESAKILTSFNFQCIELGEIIRKKWKESKSNHDFDLWYKYKEKIHGSYFTDNILVKEIKNQIAKNNEKNIVDVVLVGSRSYRGIKYLINNLLKTNESIIIYINADIKNLKKRCEIRDKKKFTNKEFELWLKKDEKMGITSILPYVNFFITNNFSKKELERNIINILTELKSIKL